MTSSAILHRKAVTWNWKVKLHHSSQRSKLMTKCKWVIKSRPLAPDYRPYEQMTPNNGQPVDIHVWLDAFLWLLYCTLYSCEFLALTCPVVIMWLMSRTGWPWCEPMSRLVKRAYYVTNASFYEPTHRTHNNWSLVLGHLFHISSV